MNQIQIGGDEKQGGGNRERPNGINMRTIHVPEDSPQERRESHGINLFGLFNPAQRRAEAAAEEARIAEQRRLEAERKAHGMAEARQQIREQAGGLERTARLPDIGMGARPALARLAQSNPERALKIARKVVDKARAYNDGVMAAQETAEAARQRSLENQRALNARPISTTQIDLTRMRVLQEGDNDNAFIRITKRGVRGAAAGISALTTIVIKGAVATASGKGASALDNIRADGSGIHVEAPLKDVPQVDIGTDLTEYDITANPPPWLDRFVGITSALPGVSRSAVLGLVPLGTVTVRRRKSGDVIAEAPTLFPSARERELKAAATRIRTPADPNIQFIPEPTLPDLLGEAADAFATEADTGLNNLNPNRPYVAPGYIQPKE
ncbi:MAG: hypothetical protein HY050_03890 [Actinobacteria bacterium]|nr:hypothetical protein [Actinomycetota bacterium]